VIVDIFSDYFPANFAVRTTNGRVLALRKMLINVTNFGDVATLFVWTVDAELVHQTPNWYVWPELAHDPQVAKWARGCLLNALLTEQVVAAWRLYSVLEDIQAYRAKPSVI
jgi:hypothetical protein